MHTQRLLLPVASLMKGRIIAGLLTAAMIAVPAVARGADLEGEPIRYTTAPADNAISRLQQAIDAGKSPLAHEPKFGYLRSVLRTLNIPSSSQVLVFTKTSLQNQRIGPNKPRALYFNDDTYVGFCQKGDLVEVTTADPRLGLVFYALEQKHATRPQFVRQYDACMICHGSSQNEGLPGTLARSVYADEEGYGIFSSGSFRVDHCTPFKQRWGGWYVTGTSGKQTHLGNLTVTEKQQPETIDNTAGTNVTDLSGRFNTSAYVTPHSDIVALMVLEHQAAVHNRIARANLLTRMALYDEAEINKALGRPVDYRSESTASRIKSAGDPLVKYLLLSGEAKLTEQVRGTSGFAEEFAARGPRDPKGRSLRDLDLQRRLFRYPCSYLIYSVAFDGLPEPVKDYVLRRVWDVLTGKDASEDFAHLSAADRRAILEILVATKANLPAYWRAKDQSARR